jgi:RNA polymerase sigma-70 factor (ECF subfamily)
MILQQSQRIGQCQRMREQADSARLVRAAQGGNRQAFGKLVTRYERVVYGTAMRRLENHAEAQELCQEVFMQALRKLGQLRDCRCFGGWLRSIAERMAINRAMRQGPLVPTDPQVFNTTCVERGTPLSVALARERQAQVHVGLGRLGAMDRATLIAFYFDGHSLAEMSKTFASPVGTIKRRLHVARKRLAKELQGLAVA